MPVFASCQVCGGKGVYGNGVVCGYCNGSKLSKIKLDKNQTTLEQKQ